MPDIGINKEVYPWRAHSPLGGNISERFRILKLLSQANPYVSKGYILNIFSVSLRYISYCDALKHVMPVILVELSEH
jgi:hypothetical protein